MTAAEMESRIAEWLGTRSHLIVPRVSWGLGLHECDLLALSRSGYATEIEIKVSVSDLRRDKKKDHGHRSGRIKYLYFAITEAMRDRVDLITDFPEHAGIIVVPEQDGHNPRVLRQPQAQPARAFTEREMYELSRNCTIKMWFAFKEIQGILENQQHFYRIPKEPKIPDWKVSHFLRKGQMDLDNWELGGA